MGRHPARCYRYQKNKPYIKSRYSRGVPIPSMNQMLSCAGADCLSSGMRHSYGKPIGVAACVDIGQILVSIRGKDASERHIFEAIRRGKFQFADRQKILKSKKWGFTKYLREDYVNMRKSGELTADGNMVKVQNRRGPLAKSSLFLNGHDW